MARRISGRSPGGISRKGENIGESRFCGNPWSCGRKSRQRRLSGRPGIFPHTKKAGRPLNDFAAGGLFSAGGPMHRGPSAHSTDAPSIPSYRPEGANHLTGASPAIVGPGETTATGGESELGERCAGRESGVEPGRWAAPLTLELAVGLGRVELEAMARGAQGGSDERRNGRRERKPG